MWERSATTKRTAATLLAVAMFATETAKQLTGRLESACRQPRTPTHWKHHAPLSCATRGSQYTRHHHQKGTYHRQVKGPKGPTHCREGTCQEAGKLDVPDTTYWLTCHHLPEKHLSQTGQEKRTEGTCQEASKLEVPDMSYNLPVAITRKVPAIGKQGKGPSTVLMAPVKNPAS